MAKLVVKDAGREEDAAEQVRRVLRARHGLTCGVLITFQAL